MNQCQSGGEDKQKIKEVLTTNKDLFAWTTSDISGIDPRTMPHRLSVCHEAKPMAQRKRMLGEERRLAAEAKASKLKQVGFIREVQYTTWLANIVLVKKSNGQWCMCTDYTDLNNACPKDVYPLPNINRLVDGAAGHDAMSFLDAYLGYNQIPMHESDKPKTNCMTCTVLSPGVDQRSKSTCGRTPRGNQGRKSTD